MKLELRQMFGWSEERTGDQMMSIMRHWGSRLRMSSGVKRGSVINNSIEEQIANALDSLSVFVQPSRHRDEHDRIVGLDVQPDVIPCYYTDYS
jgi:hypothetical protein